MKTFNCWFPEREDIERFQVKANDPYEATEKVREHLYTLSEDSLPSGNYEVTISKNGDIKISWDEKAEKLRQLFEQSDCPISFHRVLSCGCREEATLRAKKQPTTKHHRRSHGGRWNKLRKKGR